MSQIRFVAFFIFDLRVKRILLSLIVSTVENIMKPAQIVFVLVLLDIFCACRNDSPAGVQFRSIPDKSDIFKVTLEARVAINDTLSVYYTTDGSSNFSNAKAIWMPVKGNSKKQKIVFSLPNKLVPTQLRIDLGANPRQPDIHLSKVFLSYSGKSVELPGTLIFSYFRPDVKKTKIDAATGMIRGIIKDGVRQSPSLYPKEKLLRKQIEMLDK